MCDHNGNETIPAMPSTVNIVTNQFLVDGDTTVYPNETLTPVGSVLTLGHVPVNGTFNLFKNGQRLTLTTDFTITDGTVTLKVAPTAEDVFTVNYLATP